MTVIQFPEQADALPLTKRVSAEVRALCGRHEVSQTLLASWLGLTQPAISARLRGVTEWKVTEIDRIAEGFAVHPASLMGGYSTGPTTDGGAALPIKAGRGAGGTNQYTDLRIAA